MSRSIDTLRIARKKFPGAPVSLDALCRRFSIDNTSRNLHGALLDAELLAEVYLELIGGRQSNFELTPDETFDTALALKPQRREHRLYNVSEAEKSAHTQFLKKIKNPRWGT